MISIDVVLIYLVIIWSVLGIHHVMEDDDEPTVTRLQAFIFLWWGGPAAWCVFVVMSLMMGYRNIKQKFNEWRD